MAIDIDHLRAKLAAARQALFEEDRLGEQDRAPVALDQESVGRLSRMDAMQIQAMAAAQLRCRQAERAAIKPTLTTCNDRTRGG